MPRGYELPDKDPGESNDDWCNRAAESIPAEVLMRQLIAYLMRKKKWNGAWSFVGDFTCHGSGVAGAIVRRFLPEDNPPESP